MPSVARLHALAAVFAFAMAGAAHAGPITGSGQPVSTEQPSLGLTYLVRTETSNFADLGEVTLFAGNFAPGGYDTASGQDLPISSNAPLFSNIGTTYGGNGFTNFALPNLEGRSVVGAGSGAGLTPFALGSVTGATTETLTAGELPPFGAATGINSGSQPLPIRQPSIALNQTVVLNGAFPSSTGPQATAPLIGQVLTYAGFTLPANQVAANGQALPINQFQAAFSLLGNTYGGSFPTTFGLPNLAGRAAAGAGAAPGLTPQSLGATQGAETATLTTANLPPQPLLLPNGKTAVVGGGQPFSIQQPTLGLNYIIAVQGVFPTQSATVPDGTPFLGQISLFAGTVAPSGWAFATGQQLQIASNPALFAVLGTTYGGNGVTTFALPDLRDRIPVGTGGGVTLGEGFGVDTDTLDFAQLPVGYPPAVQLTATVPEPPGVAVLLAGLLGLRFARLRCGWRHPADAVECAKL